MSDVQISALSLIRRLQKKMDEIAHNIAEGAMDEKQYFMAVGKYRQCRGISQHLEQMIEKRSEAAPPARDEREFADLDDDPDDPEGQDDRPPRRRLGGKPHSWGGA